jgi:hypothetical protein
MVPSDPIHSLVHHRHARCEHRNRRVLGASPVGSPNAVFSSVRINACKRAAGSAPIGVRFSKRPFARPQRPRLSALPFRGQRSRPTPSNPDWVTSRPFGPSAPQPRPVRPSRDCFNASDPLPDLRQSIPTFPNVSTSPLGLLPPLGIRVFNVRPAGELTFRTRPIPVRSPLPSSIKITDCGSSFPDRYVSGGSLFLKPLGTFIRMRPIRSECKRSLCLDRPFSSRKIPFISNRLPSVIVIRL